MIAFLIQSIENTEDKDFLIETYEKYSGLIRGKAMTMMKSQWDADDVEQEVVVKIIASLEILKKLSSKQMTAYINIMVKNAAIDFYKKKKKTTDYEFTYELIENQIFQEDFDCEDISKCEIAKSLDKRTMKFLYEKYVDKSTIEEIANRYGMTKDAVASIIYRGKIKFKKYNRR